MPNHLTRPEPTEYLNNAHLLQMEREGYAALPSELAKVGYEHTFEFSSLHQLRDILRDGELKRDLRRRMGKFAFVRTTCIFKQEGSFDVPFEDQKGIVDYQQGLFSDVTVTHLEDNVEALPEVIEYARKTGQEVAVLTDLHYDDEILRTGYNLIADAKDVERVKVYSLRIVGNVTKYRLIQRVLSTTGKHLHLTHCQRTISSDGVEDLSYEHLAATFGFSSFTQNYSEHERKKAPGARFVPKPFNRATLCYQQGRMLGSYRQQKFVDLGNVAAELDLLIAAVRRGELANYLRSKPALRQMLAELRVAS